MNIDKALLQLEKASSLANALCALMIQDGMTASAVYILAEMIREATSEKAYKEDNKQ